MSWRNAIKPATAGRVKQARAAPLATRPLGSNITLFAKTGPRTASTTNTSLRGKAPHLFVPRGIKNAKVNVADAISKPPSARPALPSPRRRERSSARARWIDDVPHAERRRCSNYSMLVHVRCLRRNRSGPRRYMSMIYPPSPAAHMGARWGQEGLASEYILRQAH